MTRTKPKPPRGLRPATRAWWLEVVEGWTLEAHHRHLLSLACTSWDRIAEARELIETQGLTVTDRFGQTHPHPALAVERDHKILFCRLVRELDLDLTPPVDVARRPPALPSIRR